MIHAESLSKTYVSGRQRQLAVRDVSFDNPRGRFLTLLGPSGCGKSTILRCIAGLEVPEEGEIHVDGEAVFSSRRRINVPPAKRRLGMVFQSYAVWPHMTVYKNVEYPLKRQRIPRPERARLVREALEMTGLAQFAKRPAPNLSGGQQQRVALARALVAKPKLLLLDEPLSNLDAKLRRELGDYLRDLQERLGLTVIYVTHDQSEAMSMSDEVILLREGRIIERGAPETLYRSPATSFGAHFVGEANFIEGRHSYAADGSPIVKTSYGDIFVRHEDDLADSAHVDDTAVVMIRPEDLTVAHPGQAPDADAVNVFTGLVRATRFLGAFYESVVESDEGRHVLRAKTVGQCWWDVGDLVQLRASPAASVAVRATSGSTSTADRPTEAHGR